MPPKTGTPFHPSHLPHPPAASPAPHPPTPRCRGGHGVQLGDQLRDHAVHDAARVAAAAARGRQGVQLVEEQDAGRQVTGVLEERPPWGIGEFGRSRKWAR